MNMKKLVAVAVTACGSTGLFAAAVDAMTQDPNVVMTSLSVRQRYPWNGKVDIDFSFTSSIPEAFAFIQFKATYVDKAGETVSIPMKTFDQVSIPWCTNAGAYRVTWDSTADAPNLRITNLEYTVTANMAKYMVVDLSKGTAATADDPYPITYMEECPDPTRDDGGWTDEYRTTKMVFRLVQPGTYVKGWNNQFTTWNDAEKHNATITRPFYLAIFECTQGQARRVMGTWFGTQSLEFYNSDFRERRPVACASYNAWRGKASDGFCWPNHGSEVDPSSFIGQFRIKTGNDNGFDMPTETEWEYAARAGSTDAWGGDGLSNGRLSTSDAGPTGGAQNSLLATLGRYKYNGGYINNGGSYSKPAYTCTTNNGTMIVGSYKPNAWGFYDMLGNISECALDYKSGSMSNVATIDDVGPEVADPSSADSINRATRGGTYASEAKGASLVARPNMPAGHEINGCRLAWRFPFAGTQAATE